MTSTGNGNDVAKAISDAVYNGIQIVLKDLNTTNLYVGTIVKKHGNRYQINIKDTIYTLESNYAFSIGMNLHVIATKRNNTLSNIVPIMTFDDLAKIK